MRGHGHIGHRRAAARRSCALPTGGARAPVRGPAMVPSPSSTGRHGWRLLLLSSLDCGVESRGEGEEKEKRPKEPPERASDGPSPRRRRQLPPLQATRSRVWCCAKKRIERKE
jgi:hypothetical protein